MNKIFNLHSTFKSEAQEDGSVMVRGMASTADFDRAGDSIVADAWTKGGLGNFEKNPIILFNHDYNKPIGRATKVTPTAEGLHMEAKISKHAECADLIKDGVLGAFSVGFKVKDADYLKETDGLMIKDAELFEVSVVSVPCNQAATFSLAKSFDSEMEYEDFKKTFKSEEDSSSKEIDMSEATQTPEIDLEAFAKKVAEETAAKISMKQAEQKAAEKAEAEKAAEAKAAQALEAEKIQATIKSGIETGAEKLVSDLKAEFEKEAEANTGEIAKKYEAIIKEKDAELKAMAESKRQFADRGATGTKGFEKEILHASILGKITGKGWDTDYGKDIMQKVAGVGAGDAGSLASNLDIVTTTAFEEVVKYNMELAPLFQEIQVQSGKTILPLVPDSLGATFSSAGIVATTGADTTANMLTDDGSGTSAGDFNVSQKTLTATRLISGTFIPNDTEEQVLVTLLPMLTTALARAHAKKIDETIAIGTSGIKGLFGGTGTEGANSPYGETVGSATAAAAVSPSLSQTIRAGMGKYGINPNGIVFIVAPAIYYTLIQHGDFDTVTEVGSDIATRRVGTLGAIFGTRVVVSDRLAGAGTGKVAIGAVYPENYVIPRLKGVSIETDYNVAQQRTAIVASQSLGFEELYDGTTGNQPAVYNALS